MRAERGVQCRGPRSWRPALIGGLILIGALGACFHWASDVQNAYAYVSEGEGLVHGVGASSYFLPSAQILAVLLYSHWHLTLPAVQFVFRAILAILMLAADATLGAQTIMGLAPAVAVFLCRGTYPHGFFALLVLSAACFLMRYARTPTKTNALWLALAIGGSFMFRSSMLLLPPLMALFALAFWLPARFDVRAKHALILILVPYIFVLPVVRMNYKLHHRFIPFEDGEASCNVVTGALGVVETIDGHWQTLLPASADLSSGGILLWAGNEIIRHPLRYGAAYFLRLGQVAAWYFLSGALALWALWIHRARREFQALAVVVGYWVGIHCLMPVESSYFDPVRPLLILMACSLAPRSASTNPAAPRVFAPAVLASSLVALFALNFEAIARMQNGGKVALEQAIEASPNDWWLLKRRGENRLKNGALSGAAEDFSRSLAAMGADLSKGRFGLEAESELAAAELFMNRPERALKLPIDEQSESDPTQDVRASLMRAYAWASVDRPGNAREAMKSAMRRWVSYRSAGGLPYARDRQVVTNVKAAAGEEFAPWIEQTILNAWPAANKTTLAALLASTYPHSASAGMLYAGSLKEMRDSARRSADTRLGAGDFKGALEQLDVIGGPEDADLLIKKARACAGLGRKGLAFSMLERAAALRPRPIQRRQIAEVYSGLKAFPRALEELDAIAGPEDADLLIGKAAVYMGLKNASMADAFLARAAKSAADPEQVHAIALLYQDLGSYDRARDLLEGLTEAHPENIDYLVSRGVCEYMAGAADRSETTLKKAIRLNRAALSAYLSLGYIYEKQQRYEQAVGLYELALSRTSALPAGPLRQAVAEALARLKART